VGLRSAGSTRERGMRTVLVEGLAVGKWGWDAHRVGGCLLRPSRHYFPNRRFSARIWLLLRRNLWLAGCAASPECIDSSAARGDCGMCKYNPRHASCWPNHSAAKQRA
jgi:hypothetical protein